MSQPEPHNIPSPIYVRIVESQPKEAEDNWSLGGGKHKKKGEQLIVIIWNQQINGLVWCAILGNGLPSRADTLNVGRGTSSIWSYLTKFSLRRFCSHPESANA